jgi:hypothetical protein
MKRATFLFAGLVTVSLLLGTSLGWAQTTAGKSSGLVSPGVPAANPLKVALLHWYKANTTTSFIVGNLPDGVAFDGANIWTANFNDGTVSKLQANDGTLLGTFNAGVEPFGVTFDGANIWVSNLAAGTVTKMQASTGKILGTFTWAATPAGWHLTERTSGCRTEPVP